MSRVFDASKAGRIRILGALVAAVFLAESSGLPALAAQVPCPVHFICDVA